MNNYRIDAKSIKEQAWGRWLDILPLLDARLADAVRRVGKHVPCPVHGGKDGFRLFAEKNGGGACNTCGTFADGFAVLQWLRGCTFYESLKLVNDLLNNGTMPNQPISAPIREIPQEGDRYNAAIKYLLDTSSRTPNRAARAYFERRGIAASSSFISNSLHYHDSADVYHNGRRVVIEGKPLRYPCLLGLARNAYGVTGLHQIYLTTDGMNAANEISHIINAQYSKKRMIGKFIGTAVRLAKAEKNLMVCEGIETALAIRLLTGSNSIAACGTANLLSNLDIPVHVETLMIYMDNDKAGNEAAEKLKIRESVLRNVEIYTPPTGKDFLDYFISINS